MAHHAAGRHRAPGRYNPLSELTGIVAQSAQPAVKTSAVLAASGGLVAAFAIPAQAASAEKTTTTNTTASVPVAVKAPAAAAPAQTAFGEIGFTATAKPKPKPAPAPAPAPAPEPAPERVEQAASRSVERAPLTSTKPASGGILGIAAQYEGIMYSYGGTSPETGFDCSGYTQYVFRQVGINLPRTAEEQRQFVTPVSDPQPGDLVFFGSPAYHMGIYAGNGMMWDSPRSGKAVALRDIWSADVTYGRP
ncbi:MAG TPA: C40 family peptidase [Streptomyces sp.]|nr:C40 family peptidase [Streptomyces sp.]